MIDLLLQVTSGGAVQRPESWHVDLVRPKKPPPQEYVATEPTVVSEKVRVNPGMFRGGRPQPSIQQVLLLESYSTSASYL